MYNQKEIPTAKYFHDKVKEADRKKREVVG
jgi:hypothetical protein